VTVNGVSAPLYYVSPRQLNVQVPYETGLGTAIVGVNNNGQVASFPFQVAATAPGMYSGFITPAGAVVTTAQQGAPMLLYITGEGDVTPTLATGAAPSSKTPIASLPQPRLPVTVMVGGGLAQVDFVGIPPGLAGVTQINFKVPADAPPGPQPVVVKVGDTVSQTVMLNVTK
jgi:uncharacterized protein (TIGR03437 family)